MRLFLLPMSLVLALCVHAMPARTGAIPDIELDALLDLYHSTNGPTWRKNRWPKKLQSYRSGNMTQNRSALKPCAWRGVECRQGHVVTLSLEHSLNGGILPASLAALHQVEVLDLGSNKLQGSLPAEWGVGLQACVQIEMDGNQFTGTVPEEWAAFADGRAPPREGAAVGGARIFLGFNNRIGEPESGKFGFQCPYPAFLLNRTEVLRGGKRAAVSNIATAWGLPAECGLTNEDQTPDEEGPMKKKAKKTTVQKKTEL